MDHDPTLQQANASPHAHADHHLDTSDSYGLARKGEQHDGGNAEQPSDGRGAEPGGEGDIHTRLRISLARIQRLGNSSDGAPVPSRSRNSEDPIELAEIADDLHVAPVDAKTYRPSLARTFISHLPLEEST